MCKIKEKNLREKCQIAADVSQRTPFIERDMYGIFHMEIKEGFISYRLLLYTKSVGKKSLFGDWCNKSIYVGISLHKSQFRVKSIGCFSFWSTGEIYGFGLQLFRTLDSFIY